LEVEKEKSIREMERRYAHQVREKLNRRDYPDSGCDCKQPHTQEEEQAEEAERVSKQVATLLSQFKIAHKGDPDPNPNPNPNWVASKGTRPGAGFDKEQLESSLFYEEILRLKTRNSGDSGGDPGGMPGLDKGWGTSRFESSLCRSLKNPESWSPLFISMRGEKFRFRMSLIKGGGLDSGGLADRLKTLLSLSVEERFGLNHKTWRDIEISLDRGLSQSRA